MRINKLFYAMLVALSASPIAFAQYIGSAHGQAQGTATADSATQIDGMNGIVKAPKSNIGSGDASGNAAASQTYETRIDMCPSGFTGTQEMTRKVFIRQNGSRFEDAWVMKSSGCLPIKDPAIDRLRDEFVAAFNIIGGRVDQLENRPTGGGAGTLATRFFTLTTSQTGGSNTSTKNTFVCVNGITYVEDFGPNVLGIPQGNFLPGLYPQPNVRYPQTVDNPIFWSAYVGKPYANWQATGMHGGSEYGPICPQGSYLHMVGAQQIAGPDAP